MKPPTDVAQLEAALREIDARAAAEADPNAALTARLDLMLLLLVGIRRDIREYP